MQQRKTTPLRLHLESKFVLPTDVTNLYHLAVTVKVIMLTHALFSAEFGIIKCKYLPTDKIFYF